MRILRSKKYSGTLCKICFYELRLTDAKIRLVRTDIFFRG